MGWTVAAILYALPILAGIRHFDEAVEDCLEWMRGEDGEWFPSLAPFAAAVSILLWPLFCLTDAFEPKDREE